jgi:hypothetical protein
LAIGVSQALFRMLILNDNRVNPETPPRRDAPFTRRNNGAYNETPTERLAMKPQLKKTIVKIVIGTAFSTAIGYVIKLERKIEDRIDAGSED